METICVDNGISDFGCSLITGGMYFAYFLFIVALVASVGLPLISALKAPKDLVKSGLAVVALVVVFGVAYALSDDEVTLVTASYGVTPSSSKFIGAGLIMLYIVFFTAVAGLVYSFIAKAIK